MIYLRLVSLLGPSFFVHFSALLVIFWGAHRIVELQREVKLLSLLSRGVLPKTVFFLSPLYYSFILAKVFEVEFHGRPMLLWPNPLKIKAHSLYQLISSQHLSKISAQRTPVGWALILVLKHDVKRDKVSLIETLSQDLGLGIKIEET